MYSAHIHSDTIFFTIIYLSIFLLHGMLNAHGPRRVLRVRANDKKVRPSDQQQFSEIFFYFIQFLPVLTLRRCLVHSERCLHFFLLSLGAGFSICHHRCRHCHYRLTGTTKNTEREGTWLKEWKRILSVWKCPWIFKERRLYVWQLMRSPCILFV